MKKLSRVLLGVLTGLGLLTAPQAHAQAYPNKTIRIIIPAAASGPTDTMGRVLAKVMSEQHGIPVIVENKAGAAGSIGVHHVVQSPPDGYTVVIAAIDAITVYPLVKKNAPYRVARDLTPLTMVASTPFVFAVPAQLPAKNMTEFVNLAKTQKLAYASPGTGASAHVVLEMLKFRSNMDLLHVPYPGAAPSLLSLIAGDTQITATSPVTLKGHIDSGKLRALAVTTAKRNPMLPNVPTMIESGFPDFAVTAWFGAFAPAGVPDAVADKLNDMLASAMRSPEYVSKIGGLGLDVEPMKRKDFAQMLSVESDRWRQIIEAAKISAD